MYIFFAEIVVLAYGFVNDGASTKSHTYECHFM